jgi:hypothetical protein
MSNKAPQYTITTAKVAAVRTALKNEAQAERKISKADALMQAAGVQQTSNAQKLATMFQKDVAKFGATVVAKAIREELNLVSDKVDGVQLNAAYGRFNVLWTRAQSLMEGV